MAIEPTGNWMVYKTASIFRRRTKLRVTGQNEENVSDIEKISTSDFRNAAVLYTARSVYAV